MQIFKCLYLKIDIEDFFSYALPNVSGISDKNIKNIFPNLFDNTKNSN